MTHSTTTVATTMGFCPTSKAVCHRPYGVPLCISIERVCDGINDCYQGHDEERCPHQTTTVQPVLATPHIAASRLNQNVNTRSPTTASTHPTRTSARQATVERTSNVTPLIRDAKSSKPQLTATTIAIASITFGIVLVLTVVIVVFFHRRKTVQLGRSDGPDIELKSTASLKSQPGSSRDAHQLETPLMIQTEADFHIYDEITEGTNQTRPLDKPVEELSHTVSDTSDHGSCYIDVLSGSTILPRMYNVSSDRALSLKFTEQNEKTILKMSDIPQNRGSAYADVRFPHENHEGESHYEPTLKTPSMFDSDEQPQYLSLCNITPRQSSSSNEWQPVDSNDKLVSSDFGAEDYLTPPTENVKLTPSTDNVRLLPQDSVSSNDDVTGNATEDHRTEDYLNPVFASVNDMGPSSDPDYYMNPVVANDNTNQPLTLTLITACNIVITLIITSTQILTVSPLRKQL